MSAAGIVALVVRYGMVLLFLPFSALDKVLNFDGAVGQAQEVFKPRRLAVAVLLMGLAIEIVCTLGVVSGLADRACAFVIAGYLYRTAIIRTWDRNHRTVVPEIIATGLRGLAHNDCTWRIKAATGIAIVMACPR